MVASHVPAGGYGPTKDGVLRHKNPETVSDRFSKRWTPVNFGTDSSQQTPPLAWTNVLVRSGPSFVHAYAEGKEKYPSIGFLAKSCRLKLAAYRCTHKHAYRLSPTFHTYELTYVSLQLNH